MSLMSIMGYKRIALLFIGLVFGCIFLVSGTGKEVIKNYFSEPPPAPPSGDLRVKLTVTQLYSNAYETCGNIRHSWFFEINPSSGTDTNYWVVNEKNNTRPYRHYPNLMIYNGVVSGNATSLPTLDLEFIGYEDERPHGGKPDSKDLNGGGCRPDAEKGNYDIDIADMKMGANYRTYGGGRWTISVKIELSMDDFNFLPTEVEAVATTPTSEGEPLVYQENSNLCSGRDVKLLIQKPDNVALIEKDGNNFYLDVDSYKEGDDTPIYTYTVESFGGGSMQRAASTEEGIECDYGVPLEDCGPYLTYNPSCERCIEELDYYQENWRNVELKNLSNLGANDVDENGNYIIIDENVTRLSGQDQTDIIYRARIKKGSGYTPGNVKEDAIFIQAPEPRLLPSLTGLDINVHTEYNTLTSAAEAVEVFPANISDGGGDGTGPTKPIINGLDPIDPGEGSDPTPYVEIRHIKDTDAGLGTDNNNAQIIINRVHSGTGNYNIYVRKISGISNSTFNIFNKTANSTLLTDDAVFPDESNNSGSHLEAGDYALMVENRKDGEFLCYSYYEFEIKKPANPLRVLAPTHTDIENPGSSTGSITASASGGVKAENYQFALYKTGYGSNPYRPYQNSGTFSNLPAGTYQVQVKDDLGVEKWYGSDYYNRSDATNISIDEAVLDETNFGIDNDQVETVNSNVYYVNCREDDFNVNVDITSPDNLTLEYALKTSATAPANQSKMIDSNPVNLNDRDGGTYKVYTRKADGGTTWYPVSTSSIEYNKPPSLDTPSINNIDHEDFRVSCHNADDGILEISNIGGGVGSIDVHLLKYVGDASDPEEIDLNNTDNSMITVSNLESEPTQYKVRFTDELGCSTVYPSTDNNFIEFDNPDLIEFNNTTHVTVATVAQSYHAECYDNDIIINTSFTGGWGDQDFTLELIDDTDAVVEDLGVQTSGYITIGFVPTGSYRLKLSKGTCDVVTSGVFDILTPAAELEFTSATALEYDNNLNLTCFESGDENVEGDGRITVTTSGGVGDHTVNLIATVDGTIIDELGDSKTEADNSFTFTGLVANYEEIDGTFYPVNYTFSLEDELGCEVNNYPDTPITLEEPDEIIIDNLSADEIVDGSGYHIQCKGGSTSVSFTISGGIGNENDETNYPMELKLSNGETDKDVFKTVNAPGTYSFTGVQDGGDSPYNISVESMEHYACNFTNNSDGGILINEVQDAFEVQHGKRDYGQEYNVSCKYAGDAELSFTVSGGFLNGGGINQTEETLTYTFDNVSYSLTSPQIEGNKKVFSNLPAENSDGTVVNYDLVVYDLLGCPVPIDNITFKAPDQLLAIDDVDYSDHNGYQIQCHDGMDQIEVWASGGVLPYSFNLTSADGEIDEDIEITEANTPAIFDELPAGTYNLTLVDDTGCPKGRSNITLTQPDEIKVSSQELIKPTCAYAADGQIIISLEGGYLADGSEYEIKLFDLESTETEPYYSGTGVNDVNILVPEGNYELKVTDDNQCGFNSPVYIEMENRPELTIETDGYDYPLCYGGSTGKLKFKMKGGLTTADYTARLYDENWSKLDSLIIEDAQEYTFTEFLFDSLWAADYHIVLEDGFSCLDSMSASVEERQDRLSLNLESFSKTSCSNTKDGTITMKATGGDQDYVFSIDGINFYPTVPAGEMLKDTVVTDTITYYNKIYSDSIVWGGLAGGKTYHIYLRDRNWNNEYDSAVCTIENSFFLPMTDSITIQFEKEDVSCFGAMDGRLKATALMGTLSSGFQYKWYRSNTNIVLGEQSTITGLGPGNYDLLVFNEEKPECSEIFTAQINSPSKPLRAIQKSAGAVTCDGSKNGVIRFSLEGGYSSGDSIEVSLNKGLSFVRYPLSSSRGVEITGLAAGSYPIIIRDIKNGCTDEFSMKVPYGQLAFEVLSTKNPSCYGTATGSISLASNFENVTYQLLDQEGELLSSARNGNFDGLKAASYQLTAFQFGQCYGDTISVNLVDSALLEMDELTINHPSCGKKNGFINATAKGGTSPYEIEYIDQRGNSINPEQLFAGFYQVKISDAKGCTWNEEVILENQNTLNLQHELVDSLNCEGKFDYALTATGGLAPYSLQYEGNEYRSDDGNFQLQFKNKDIHQLMLSDQVGCDKVFEIATESYIEPQISIVYQQKASCGLSNGWAEISVNGADPSAEIIWPDDITEVEGMRAYGLSGDKEYTIYLNDERDCSYPFSFSIGNKETPEIQYEILNSPSCELSNGSIELQNDWALNMYLNGEEVPTSGVLSLGAGSHTLRAITTDSCVSSTNFSISDVDVNEDFELIVTNECAENQVELKNNGNHIISNIQWSHGLDEGLTFTNYLPSGGNWVVYELRNGCEFTQYFEVPYEGGEFWIADYGKPECNGDNGFIQLDQTSSSLIDHYEWSHELGLNANRAENLVSGNYEIIGYDAENCEQDRLIFFLDTEESDLFYSITAYENSSCPAATDGVIDLTIIGGKAPYQLFLDNESVESSATIEGISSGTHELIVQDANNCSYKNTFFLGYEQPVVIDSIRRTEPSCFDAADGEVELFISGGSEDMQIIWPNGSNGLIGTELAAGEHLIQIQNGECIEEKIISLSAPSELQLDEVFAYAPTCVGGSDGSLLIDVNGGTSPYTVEWSNGSLGEGLQAAAGTYTVSVTDAQNCFKELSLEIPNRPVVEVEAISIPPSCNGASNGEISLQFEGMSFSVIRWDSGELGATTRGVGAGVHSYIIEDQFGCKKEGSVTLAEPDLLQLDLIYANNPNCSGAFDGSIKVAASGGNGGYQFEWSNGRTGSEISRLKADSYEVVVTDSLGCNKRMTVELTDPAPLEIQLEEIHKASCSQGSDGGIDVNIVGGISPYTYLWSNGSTDEQLDSVSAGYHQLTITDKNGCTAEKAFRIPATSKIIIDSVYTQRPSCAGESDGLIFVQASGGTGELSYRWDSQNRENTLENIPQGTYTVTITDRNGCTLSLPITISDPGSLDFRLNETNDPSCNGESDGNITLEVVAGTPPYSYSWSNGESTDALEGLPAGVYSVVVTDASGCTITEDFELEDPPKYEITDIDELITICTGGSVSLDAGDLWSEVEWSSENGFNANGQKATISAEGFYTITAWTEEGCSDSFEFELRKEDGILTADFVITSTSYVHDTIVVVDISKPIPESVDWENDPDLELITQNDLHQKVVAREVGLYKIKMTAYSGTCTDQIEKWIEVTERPDGTGEDDISTNERAIEGEFEKVVISPNPNHGDFSLNVEMNVSSNLKVMLFNPQMAFVVAQQESKQSNKVHEFNFEGLNIAEGFYIVRLISEFGETSRKVIIK